MKLNLKGLASFGLGGILTLFLMSGITACQQRMPDSLDVTTLDGQIMNLDSLKGKPYLLVFWSVTCPGCVKEIPELQALNQKMQGTGFRIIGIAMSYDELSEIKAMREKKSISYTLAYDQNGELSKQFDVRVTPTSFLVDADGKIRVQKLGEWNPAELEQKIRDLLKG